MDRKNVKVFLSHSSNDKEIVLEVRSRLESAGFNTWLDVKELTVGDELLSSITKGIDESNFFAFFLSRSSIKSNWVQDELRIAYNFIQNSEKKIFPILLEDIPENEIPGYIRGRIYAKLTDRKEQSVINVTQNIIKSIYKFYNEDYTQVIDLTNIQKLVLKLIFLPGMARGFLNEELGLNNISPFLLLKDGTISEEVISELTEIPHYIIEQTMQDLSALGFFQKSDSYKNDESYEEGNIRREVIQAILIGQKFQSITNGQINPLDFAALFTGVPVNTIDDMLDKWQNENWYGISNDRKTRVLNRAINNFFLMNKHKNEGLLINEQNIMKISESSGYDFNTVSDYLKEYQGKVNEQITQETIDILYQAGIINKRHSESEESYQINKGISFESIVEGIVKETANSMGITYEMALQMLEKDPQILEMLELMKNNLNLD